MKHLLLGDEAIAQGAIDAGLSGVYAYPGTPSTEITEYIQLCEKRKALSTNSVATGRYSANGQPMRRLPWKALSECRIWASVR